MTMHMVSSSRNCCSVEPKQNSIWVVEYRMFGRVLYEFDRKREKLNFNLYISIRKDIACLTSATIYIIIILIITIIMPINNIIWDPQNVTAD